MNPIVIRFTVIALVFSAVWILMEHLLGFNSTRHDIGQYTRPVPMIMFWMLIIIAIWQTRREHGGVLSLDSGLRTGIPMAVLYSAFFTLIIIFYVMFINPAYHQTLRDFTQHELEARNASQQEINEALQEVDMTAGGSAVSYLLLFIFSSLFGIGVAFLSTLLFRTSSKKAL